jgi:hypothetical protein
MLTEFAGKEFANLEEMLNLEKNISYAGNMFTSTI